MWFPLSAESYRDLSLHELALSAIRFDPLVVTLGVLGEPASLDAHASERCLIVCGDVSCGLSVKQDQIQVLGLALRGVAPVSHLITYDAATRRWVILLLMRTQACCVPPVTETLLGV